VRFFTLTGANGRFGSETSLATWFNSTPLSGARVKSIPHLQSLRR
jgi:hypothetical protein